MIDYVAAVLGIIGSILLARGSQHLVKYSFVFYWIASSLWIIYGVTNEIYSLVLVNVVFIVVESMGAYRWYLKDNAEREDCRDERNR
jgi:hypothetical protein